MTSPGVDQGRHDIRRGATAYSAIVGTFGALAVPAIVLVFTTPNPHVPNATTLNTFATGLLVAGMFGSLLGAIGFAYIGAERDPIAALAPAIVYAAVPAVISLCSILGAFEVLSALYHPSAKIMFTIIVAAGGLFGVFYSSFAVIHSLVLGPTGEERQLWLQEQQIRERTGAKKAALLLAILTASPVVLAIVLRAASIHIGVRSIIIEIDIVVAMILIMLGPLLAVMRAAPVDRPRQQRGLRLHEIYGANFAMSGFVLMLMMTLP